MGFGFVEDHSIASKVVPVKQFVLATNRYS